MLEAAAGFGYGGPLAQDLSLTPVILSRMRRCTLVGILSAILCGCVNQTEEFRFSSSGVSLAASLYLPSGKGPFPAIVLVHGDGCETRDGYRFFAKRFAKAGVAALIYDKRGCGASAGSWPSSFAQLAVDASSATRTLRQRADIHPDRIGLWGGSQGGWIAPLAATLPETRPHFIIVKAGPAVDPATLARTKSSNRVLRAGHSAGAIESVAEIMNLQFRILRTGKGWDELDALVAKVRSESWFPLVAIMKHSSWRSSWMTYGPDIDHDPNAVLAKLRNVPILWILGEKDVEIDVEQNREVLERLRERGHRLDIAVFKGADHQIELPRSRPQRPHFAPGYLETMTEWLVDHSR